jgi:transposase-like protein
MSKKSNQSFHLRSANALFVWCRSTEASTPRCGLPSNPSPPRSAACPRPSTNGSSATRDRRRARRRHDIRRATMKELEREVKELRKANEILKLASAFFAQAELDRRLKS